MNYAEQCRMLAREYREVSNSTIAKLAGLKEVNDLTAALLDAAAGLWEAGDGMRDQMAEAMAAADAAAKGAE